MTFDPTLLLPLIVLFCLALILIYVVGTTIIDYRADKRRKRSKYIVHPTQRE